MLREEVEWATHRSPQIDKGHSADQPVAMVPGFGAIRGRYRLNNILDEERLDEVKCNNAEPGKRGFGYFSSPSSDGGKCETPLAPRI